MYRRAEETAIRYGGYHALGRVETTYNTIAVLCRSVVKSQFSVPAAKVASRGLTRISELLTATFERPGLFFDLLLAGGYPHFQDHCCYASRAPSLVPFFKHFYPNKSKIDVSKPT